MLRGNRGVSKFIKEIKGVLTTEGHFWLIGLSTAIILIMLVLQLAIGKLDGTFGLSLIPNIIVDVISILLDRKSVV